jgi:hypothetical protein
MGSENLARFNMPLELGMAVLRCHESDQKKKHEFMVLVPDAHSYKRFLSDLAGNDFNSYKRTTHAVMDMVLRWLRLRRNCPNKPTSLQVSKAWNIFIKAKAQAEKKWPYSKEGPPHDTILSIMYTLCKKQKWWKKLPWDM